MGQVVLRFRKLKGSSDAGNVANHNSRAKFVDQNGEFLPRPEGLPDKEPWPLEWIKRPKRIRQNEGTQGKGDQEETLSKGWRKTVKEAGLKRKPQNNAAKVIEAVFTRLGKTYAYALFALFFLLLLVDGKKQSSCKIPEDQSELNLLSCIAG